MMEEKLQALLERLMEEQKRLLLTAADADTMPATKTLERVAHLEMNIAAIEHLLEDG